MAPLLDLAALGCPSSWRSSSRGMQQRRPEKCGGGGRKAAAAAKAAARRLRQWRGACGDGVAAAAMAQRRRRSRATGARRRRASMAGAAAGKMAAAAAEKMAAAAAEKMAAAAAGKMAAAESGGGESADGAGADAGERRRRAAGAVKSSKSAWAHNLLKVFAARWALGSDQTVTFNSEGRKVSVSARPRSPLVLAERATTIAVEVTSPTRRLPGKENAAEVPAMAAGSTTPPYLPHATMEHATMEVNHWRRTVKSKNEEAEALFGDLETPAKQRGRRHQSPQVARRTSTRERSTHGTRPSPRSPKRQGCQGCQGCLDKEKVKREADQGKDAENATLKRQVEVLQRQLAGHRATIEDLAIEQHAEDQNYAGTRASDLLARTMLAAVQTYNGTGGATVFMNFIAKVETTAEQAELNEGQMLALATHGLSGQASILWLSHVKEHPKGSHQRWTSWKDLREALSDSFP
ncbi:MAG: hypothetical protein BJ554DRAFT_5504 [Olpidium bornovanus]|uniref:Uncharacterized protein n=1 Tax=Olpidium bornovanus TaxID=278681 RepID=A0A8H7ZZR6_9FUNG|nr:MAG: hypothetical protein BJ554DRAFT_5504 [Olpidium bornovanus]